MSDFPVEVIEHYRKQKKGANAVYEQRGYEHARQAISRKLVDYAELEIIATELDSALDCPDGVFQSSLSAIEPLAECLEEQLREDVALREVDQDGRMGVRAVAFYSGWRECARALLDQVG